MEEKKYIGKGWKFPVMFQKHQGVEMVSGEEDIRQSLQILFSTLPGERIFRSGYGCHLNRSVFSNPGLTGKTLLIREIKNAVLLYEPRIEIERVEVDDHSCIEEGIIKVSLDYRIRQTNSRSNIVYPFYLLEGTNL